MTIKQALDLVADFQQAGQQRVCQTPTKLSISEVEFRDSLMLEEVKETRYAGIDGDIVEVLDGLADQLYVLLGTVNSYGLQHVFTEAFNRVHKSNTSKLTGGALIKHPLTGKILKPDTFKPVQLADLILKNMYNSKDIQFVGKHDFDRESAERFATSGTETFSINIFKWELKSNGKEMKRGKCVVRVKGKSSDMQKVIDHAEFIVRELDNDDWDGRKTVSVNW